MGVMLMFGLFGCTKNNLPLSGSCGDDMQWEYDKKSKTLTITGSGEMVTPDRWMWSKYKIKKLVISEGVTSIAADAFYSNHELRGELVLPESLKEIGEFAFYRCDGLTGTLKIPDNVENVGSYAFVRCEGFTGLELSASLKTIGEESFKDMTGLKGTLTLPDGLETVGRCAFTRYENLRGDLIIPDSVTKVDYYSFAECGFDGEPGLLFFHVRIP